MTDHDLVARLRRQRQGAIADHYLALDLEGQAALGADLATVDLKLLEQLVELSQIQATPPPSVIRAPSVVVKGGAKAADAYAQRLGEGMVSRGTVAAIMVAGGQGSRLGHNGPKGTFPATPVKAKPLFMVFAEKLLAANERYGVKIPWCIMTSEENHADTVAFFETHEYLGLPVDSVHFFTQGMLPAIKPNGDLVLKTPTALFRSPDGHGGTLLALRKCGLLAKLQAAGIEHLSYFQVDNPLVEVIDPVFLGHHALAQSEFSSKSVSKAGPDEKVGVFAVADGRLTVIEYSDLPEDLRNARDPRGALVYSAGSIAIHAISLEFVARITETGLDLPYHLARKKLAVVRNDGTEGTVDGIKFETFVFDALVHAEHPMVMEVARAEEFAPIKNATGQDSAASSKLLQSRLFASWIEATGQSVLRQPNGDPIVPIEIAATFADSAETLRRRKIARLNYSNPVYLGGK